MKDVAIKTTITISRADAFAAIKKDLAVCWCGEIFLRLKSTKQYCSDVCRATASQTRRGLR
jgi:hypothetical protein